MTDPDAYRLPNGRTVYQDSAKRWCDWATRFPLPIAPSLEGAVALYLSETPDA